MESRRAWPRPSPRTSRRRWIRAQWLKDQPELEESTLRGRIIGAIDAMYDAKVQRIGEPIMRHVEKDIMLKVLDQQWREHLGAMDYLRQGIHLRGYAQKDYRYEYKREAFELFAAMLERIKFDTVTILATLDVQVKIARADRARGRGASRSASIARCRRSTPRPRRCRSSGAAGDAAAAAGASGCPPGSARPQMPPQQPQQPVRAAPKVGRNQPCPCGSGKKFKNCHGVLEGVE